MKTKLFISFTLLCAVLNAQQLRRCTTHERYLSKVQQDPAVAARRTLVEEQTNDWLARNPVAPQTVITIPVVVHVLYQNATQNISTAQITSQIDVLNEDYSRTNSDASNTPAAFTSVAANCDLQFCLATVDPSGNPTTGIERRSVTQNQIGNGSSYYSYAAGGLDIWDRDLYMNIWVCDIDGGFTLGYAYIPGSTGPADDGIVIDYNFFGTIGTVAPPFDLGRTATHEVGHWFNLEHIWGDEPGCTADDLVSDTPQQKGENYGCPSYPQTSQSGGRCSTSDPSSMFMNYMDYTDDACMNMFTTGQKNRMVAAINTQRSGLLTSNGCGTTGIAAHSNMLSVSVFPDPSNGIFDVRFSGEKKNVEVIIMNSVGMEVYHSAFSNTENVSVDMGEAAQGIYIAQIIADGACATRKIVIQ